MTTETERDLALRLAKEAGFFPSASLNGAAYYWQGREVNFSKLIRLARATKPAGSRDIFAICDAYESGYGHGLQNDGLNLTKTPFADPEQGEAYQIGYEEGQGKFNAKPAAADDGKAPARLNWLIDQLDARLGGLDKLSSRLPELDLLVELDKRLKPAAPDFQAGVQAWMMACFGETISKDKIERNHRFLEEALELVQALGCTASEAHQLVDYTYGRPVGEPAQEVGGVMVTLAALCLANDMQMDALGDLELQRVWTKIEKIRAKHAAKPKHSPLPETPAAPAVSVEPAYYGYWKCYSCGYEGDKAEHAAPSNKWPGTESSCNDAEWIPPSYSAAQLAAHGAEQFLAGQRSVLEGEPLCYRITDGEGGWDYVDEPNESAVSWAKRYSRAYEPLYRLKEQPK